MNDKTDHFFKLSEREKKAVNKNYHGVHVPRQPAEFKENYRSNSMRSALQFFKKKQEEEKEGIRPISRPKDWKRKEKIKQNRTKEKNEAQLKDL